MEEKSKTSKVIFMVLIISVIAIIVIVCSFMLFFRGQKNNVKEVVKTGVVTMNYKTPSNKFTLTNLTPMSNDLGKELRDSGTYFDFSISSEVKDEVQYEIALVKDSSSTIPDEDIVAYLEKQTSGSYAKVNDPRIFTPSMRKSVLGSPAQSMILYKNSLPGSAVENYRLRLWVKEGAIITDPTATYTVEVKVYGKVN